MDLVYYEGVLWVYAFSATSLCYLTYSNKWKIKTIMGLYVCIGWSCALMELESYAEDLTKEQNPKPGSRQGW